MCQENERSFKYVFWVSSFASVSVIFSTATFCDFFDGDSVLMV